MTPEQVILVQRSFNGIHSHAEDLSERFYERLFYLAPELRSLFPEDLTAQYRKLMQMLRTVVDNLGLPKELVPLVRALGRRHIGYGAEAAHYEVVGIALLWALEQVAGTRFTTDVRMAWTAAFAALAATMRDAAAEPQA